MRITNSFEGISELIAVAETNGFSSAAKRLGVSTSHVSRQVSALEARLGTVLLARTTRKVQLTEAGERYYKRCRSLVDELAEANESLMGDQIQLSGTLRVSAAGDFAERFIAPHLIEFGKLHPELNIHFDFNSRMVDFVEAGIDFAIRYGQLADSGLIARPLVNRRLVAAASQEYLKHAGTPQHPYDLKRHSCLVANNDLWIFGDDNQLIDVKVSGRWRTNNPASLLSACEAGLGVCYLPRSSYGSRLNDGSLVEVLPRYCNRTVTSWIVYANKKYMPMRSRMAIDHLLACFREWRDEDQV